MDESGKKLAGAMNAKQIRDEAVRNRPMPEGLNAAGVLYFITIRRLTQEYRRHLISETVAKEEGAKALLAFNHYDDNCRAAAHSAELWRRIERAGSRYGRERTVEAADEFFNTVYGLRREWGLESKKEGKA